MKNDNIEDYDRQTELKLNVPESVAIIGVGGVGSWVAMDFALVGVKNLVLIDPDNIENTNLNRTLFKLTDIKKPKVIALFSLIKERRYNIEVNTIQKFVENLNTIEKKMVKDCDYILDFRDNTSILPDYIAKKNIITGGYDGFEFTIHINPDYNNIFGEGNNGYRIVPSYFAVPQLLAAIIVNYVISDDKDKLTSEKIIHLNINNVLKAFIEYNEKRVDNKEMIEYVK